MIISIQRTKKMKAEEINNLVVQLGALLNNIKESFNKTTAAAGNIDFFFNTILDFSVLIQDPGNFIKNEDVVDLREILNEIIDMEMYRIHLKNIKYKLLFFDFQDNSYLMKVDKKRLQQVFLCLFRNAVQFSPKGGNIKVLVEFCKNED